MTDGADSWDMPPATTARPSTTTTSITVTSRWQVPCSPSSTRTSATTTDRWRASLAKDYANWDHADTDYPFFRTFDPWAGHSFAGGMGDGNGNGQESSSEAMQGWGGMYLLGVALDDKEMRDAGLFGWVSEARGVAEYWFDRHTDASADYTLANYHKTTTDGLQHSLIASSTSTYTDLSGAKQHHHTTL
jgi:hypothetical protein